MKPQDFIRQSFEGFEDECSESIPVETVDQSPFTDDGVLQIRESEQSVDRAIQDGRQLLQTADSLESISLTFEQFLGTGFSSQTANFADLAIRTAVKSISTEAPVIASCESFDRRPAVATRLSLESVSEWLEKLWASFKELLKHLWSTMTEFFKRIFDSNERIRQHAHKLEMKAAAVNGDAKAKVFSLTEKQTREITTDTGLIKPEQLIELREFTWFNHLAMAISDGELVKNQDQIAQLTKQMMEDASGDLTKYVDQIAKIPLPLPDLFKNPKSDDGAVVYSSPVLPGMKQLVLTVNPPSSTESTDTWKSLGKVHDFAWSKLTVEHRGDEVKPETHYSVLSPDQIKQACQNVIKAVEWVNQLKRHVNFKERDINLSLKNINADIPLKNKIAIAAAVKLISRSEMLRCQIMMKTATELMSHVRTVLQIAEHSLSQYDVA